MSFIESYKRLDNLCKYLFSSEKGISTYISSMGEISYNRFQISNWDLDYKNLKHYRYIRNQIVHDNYSSEENMCDNNDTLWLEQFYKRIIDQSDPLSMYQKALVASRQRIPKPQKQQVVMQMPVQKKKTSFLSIFVITSIIIILVILCFWFLNEYK